jgi:hypothetical protein
MRNYTTQKSNTIFTVLLGHSLIAISLYVLYRLASFFFEEIELPSNIESLGIIAFVIAITVSGTGLLLRYDMKPVRNRISIPRKEILH